MRMLKKFLRILAILLPAFLGVLFLNNNTYAVSDLTYTINSSNNGNFQYFCHNDSYGEYPMCSDYNYMQIEFEGTYSTFPNFSPTIDINFSGSKNLVSTFSLYPSNSILISLSEFNSLSQLYAIFVNSGINQSYLYSNWSVTITLMENLPGCPVCEECQPIPENPYDQKFDDIKKAIYVACATILVIYFFYMIYAIIIKPTGGK